MAAIRRIHSYHHRLASGIRQRLRPGLNSWLRLACLVMALACPLAIGTGTAQPASTPAPSDASPPATPMVPPLPSFQGRDDLILKHLDTLLPWYHNLGNGLPTIGLPSDAVYETTARQLAVQALQAAFQSAIADAALIAQSASPAEQGENSQDYARMAPQIDAQIAQIKSQLETISAKIPQSNGAALAALQQQRTRLQGDLELLNAEDAAIDQLAKSSAGSAANGASSLQRSIAQLQRSVPELGGTTAASNAAASKSASSASSIAAQPTGLISEAELLFEQASSLHKIDVLSQQTVTAERPR